MRRKQNQVADAARPKKCPKQDERLPIIRRGIEEGKSIRGIARELGCDDKTIARDLRKLALPPEQLAAILEGDSAEKYLNAALLRETGIDWSVRNKIGRRRRKDEASGKHSDQLAGALLIWLSTKDLTNDDARLVLSEAKRMSESLPDRSPDATSGTFGDVVAPVQRNREVDWLLTLPEPNFITQCARTLMIALGGVEPVQAIRQAALNKAIISVLARGRWLDRPEWQTANAIREERRIRRGGNQK